MDKEQVIELIQSAFDGVPQPDKLTLHVAEAHDNWDYDNDAIHWKKDHLSHTHWQRRHLLVDSL